MVCATMQPSIFAPSKAPATKTCPKGGVWYSGSTATSPSGASPAITIAEDLQNNEWLTKSVGEGGAGFGDAMGCGVCPLSAPQ